MQDKKSYRESMEQYAKTHYAAKALDTAWTKITAALASQKSSVIASAIGPR